MWIRNAVLAAALLFADTTNAGDLAFVINSNDASVSLIDVQSRQD